LILIQGVAVAAVTPRRASGHEIDLANALEVIDFLDSHKVDAIALLGSTGEFLHFDIEERQRLVSFAAKRSRRPLVVNVSHSNLDGALTLARGAARAGVAGLLLMPPYFFRYSQEDIKEFYLRFAADLGSAAPILLYNIPFFTTELRLETALDLLATGQFAGIKDSSGQWEYFQGLRQLCDQKPFTLLIGNDVIFTRGRCAGAHGVISGVACAAPELMLGLNRAIQSGDSAKTETLQNRLEEFLGWLNRFPIPVALKAAGEVRGLAPGPLASPLPPESQRQLAEFREWFPAWLAAVQAEAA
jgi:4-hydroxy-tetrahydrodipicolinate synthase